MTPVTPRPGKTSVAIRDGQGQTPIDLASGTRPCARSLRAIRGIAWAFATVGSAVCVLAVGGGPLASADPPDGAQSPAPYPELRYFTEIDSGPYDVPGQGFWFVTAQGLNCGIWIRGSFGCSGNIPGAPPDVHQIGWIDRDTRVHYDWTLAVRFPPTTGTLSIPPLSYIESDGTTCATTLDYSTYCVKGPWRFLITPTHTWLN